MDAKTAKRTLDMQEKTFIVGALQEILEDPDFGLELTEEAKKVLRERNQSTSGIISASDIRKKYY